MPYCVRNAKMPKKPHKIITIRNYKSYSKDNFIAQLKCVPWWIIDIFHDPQDMLLTFVSLFTDIANSCAPLIQKKVKGVDSPWLTGELRQLMSKRDRAKQQAVKTKNSDLFAQYKTLRNQVVHRCKVAKSEYYRSLISQNLDTPSKLWKSIKKILPNSNKQSTPMLQDDLGTHTQSNDIASSFNRFFSSIGTQLAAKFPAGIQIVNPYPALDCNFKFKPVHVGFTLKELQSLQSNKATGLDNINSRLLRDAAEVVSLPLTKIMNQSMKTGVIPF